MSQTSAGEVASDLEDLSQSPPRSKFRLRFSLLALFAFVTLVCLALAWLVQPNIVVATALFEVARVQPTLMGDESSVRFDEREFEIFKNTQRAKLMSHYVVNAALRRPGIASLPILTSKQDQAAWLQEHLEVEYPGDGEILAIRLRGPDSAAKEYATIVDAMAKAYEQEVIYDQKSRRLTERDLLKQGLQELSNEIKSRLESMEASSRQGSGNYKNTAEGKLQQLRLDGKIRQFQDLQRLLESIEIENSLPLRIRMIQPAVIQQE